MGVLLKSVVLAAFCTALSFIVATALLQNIYYVSHLLPLCGTIILLFLWVGHLRKKAQLNPVVLLLSSLQLFALAAVLYHVLGIGAQI